MVITVYERYYQADAQFFGVRRKGALVKLISDSEAGSITYSAAVTFFPHTDEEDFAVSYDACFETVLYSGKGRRSGKKEAACLDQLPEVIDELVQAHSAIVKWDEPLTEARRG